MSLKKVYVVSKDNNIHGALLSQIKEEFSAEFLTEDIPEKTDGIIFINGKVFTEFEITRIILSLKTENNATINYVSETPPSSAFLKRLLKDNKIKTRDPYKPLTDQEIKKYTEILQTYKPKPANTNSNKLYSLLQKAADSNIPVLLLGESGSGKNQAAKWIHEHSSRKNNPFISQSMADINPSLTESALFGTCKSSYTGAADKAGIFESAENGTLLIDEIAEATPDQQARLLSVLDEGIIKRIGSTKEIKTNCRTIFATDQDLKDLCEKKLFKKQLFYRIGVFVIQIPPLREHMEDLPVLAIKFAQEMGKTISPEAMKKLQNYNWPGNIRELHHTIQRACIYSDQSEISDEDIIFL